MSNSVTVSIHFWEPKMLQVDRLYENPEQDTEHNTVAIRIGGAGSVLARRDCAVALYSALGDYLERTQ